MARWTPPLRVPKKAHRADDRFVPVGGCGCVTCVAAREARENADDDRHWDTVGNLLSPGNCACGKPLDPDGRCSEYWNCAFSVEGVRR
jgi:hypothetical protein